MWPSAARVGRGDRLGVGVEARKARRRPARWLAGIAARARWPRPRMPPRWNSRGRQRGRRRPSGDAVGAEDLRRDVLLVACSSNGSTTPSWFSSRIWKKAAESARNSARSILPSWLACRPGRTMRRPGRARRACARNGWPAGLMKRLAPRAAAAGRRPAATARQRAADARQKPAPRVASKAVSAFASRDAATAHTPMLRGDFTSACSGRPPAVGDLQARTKREEDDMSRSDPGTGSADRRSAPSPLGPHACRRAEASGRRFGTASRTSCGSRRAI